MKKAVVIDLDGTLVRCNSFTLFVGKMMWRHPSMILYAMLRKLRLITHEKAKQLIMTVKVSDVEFDAFTEGLLPYVRRELLQRKDDEVTVLATAAPAQYACRLAAKLGVQFCVATENGAPENKGEVKLKNVRELLKKEGLTLYGVITDHIDDYPLLLENRNGWNLLVDPDRSMTEVLEKAGIDFSCKF